jgi:hypothetical protein
VPEVDPDHHAGRRPQADHGGPAAASGDVGRRGVLADEAVGEQRGDARADRAAGQPGEPAEVGAAHRAVFRQDGQQLLLGTPAPRGHRSWGCCHRVSIGQFCLSTAEFRRNSTS